MKEPIVSLQPKRHTQKAWLFFVFLSVAQLAYSQKADSTKQALNFVGSVSVTNNGFSFIPTFTLGKPALVAIFSVSGKRRLSFEPEFRYSLEDFKPWSFVFIWRYKLVRKEKFHFSLGTHLPALNFITTPVIKDSVEQDIIQARRFFPVFEAMPNYRVSKNFTMSVFCQYGKGLEKEVASDIYFISLRAGLNNIPLPKKFLLRFNPQFYYLRIGENDGFYLAGSLALARRDFPLSISTMMNKALKTEIAAKDFDWNVGLVYSFDKKYTRS